MRHRLLTTVVLAGTFVLMSGSVASAQGFGVADTCTTPTTGTNTAPNQPCWVAGIYGGDYSGTDDTSYYTQAGGHPFVGVTDFTVANSGGAPNGNVSNIRVDIPPGLISNPQATPQCTDAQFPSCPANTQLGVVQLEVYTGGSDQWLGASVYNMVPPAGKVSDYAFNIPLANARTDIIGGIRSSSDDGLYFTIAVPSTLLPAELVSSTLIFWGVPGDSAHAPDAGWSCDPITDPLDTDCVPPASAASHPSGTPFLTLPSGCLPAGQVSTLRLTDSTGDVAQATSKTPVAATGCGNVSFSPTLGLTPETTQADTPTGMRVDLHVPQDEHPNDLATSTLQTAVVTLPPGMTLNPAAANGLQACSPAQFGIGSDNPPGCPRATKVGTVEIDTPLLPNPLTGTVFLGCDGSSQQTPCTPPPGAPLTASLYVYATAPVQGIDQKLVGTVATNAATGQVTTTFANQPQVPFSDFILNFNGGPTATVANPLACGQATTSTAITPYSGNAAAAPTTSFTVDGDGAGGACAQPAPFAPGFSVKTATLQAGAFDSPLTVNVTRADQQQYLGRIVVKLPPGLVGLISRVPLCPAAQASAGSCAAGSRIGSTTVLAGAGSEPISQSGTVYLTGPYAGGPFGLSIVVSAIAGPFDLGTVVVRAAIYVDRNDAHVTVVSDPLPQIVGGVPLRLRSVNVTIDRKGFLVNPTSCSPLAIGAVMTAAQGAVGSIGSSVFQPGGCTALPFTPKLTMSMTGNDQTTVGRHPALISTVTSGLGQANVRDARITLPLSLALDPNHSEHVCQFAAGLGDSCPANTAIGSASVTTPLLSRPLTGTVYLVQGIRYGKNGQPIRTLPSLLIPLRGQVAIDVRAQTSVDSRSRLVTTFPFVPDAAISRFTLKINGGPHGILVVTGNANLCRGRQVTLAAFGAQSGASKDQSVTMKAPCARRLTVKRFVVTGSAVRVLVGIPTAGHVRATGPGLGVVGRTTTARTMWLTLPLTHRALARLDRGRKVRTRVTIRYAPRGWPMQTLTTRMITIRH